ncbi:MAG: hypothetical protein WKI04_09685 [Ferruginibacter sp.]
MEQKTMIRLDNLSYFFLFGFVLSMLIFENGFYLFVCLFTLVLLFFQVQQPYRTGVFTLILVQHILQIITSVFQANYLDEVINYRSSENSTAILLSLVGVVALFAPILYFQNKLPRVNLQDFRDSAGVLSTEKCMYLYITAFFISSSLSAVAFLFSGVTQIIFRL